MELTASLKTLFYNHSCDLEGVIAARVYGAPSRSSGTVARR